MSEHTKTIQASLTDTESAIMTATGTIDFTTLSAATRHALSTTDQLKIGADADGLSIESPDLNRLTFVSARFPRDDWAEFNAPEEQVTGRFSSRDLYKALTTQEAPERVAVELRKEGTGVRFSIGDYTITGGPSENEHVPGKFEPPLIEKDAEFTVRDGYELKGTFRNIENEHTVLAVQETFTERTGRRNSKSRIHLTGEAYQPEREHVKPWVKTTDEVPEAELHLEGQRFTGRRGDDLEDVQLNGRRIERLRAGDHDPDAEWPIVWSPKSSSELLTWCVYHTDELHNLFKRTLKDHLKDAEYQIRISCEQPIVVEREFTERGSSDGEDSRVILYSRHADTASDSDSGSSD